LPTATLSPALFSDKVGDSGSVHPGWVAEVMLLNANHQGPGGTDLTMSLRREAVVDDTVDLSSARDAALSALAPTYDSHLTKC
jgi:hypothetical protein